jgi:apolipoprotein D and lipocalin family protein
MKMRHTIAVLLASTLAASAAGSTPEPKTVARVDLQRYAGRWYEVARYPNRFQKHCVGDVVATYTLQPDGKIGVDNRCRDEHGGEDRAHGLARNVSEDGSNSKLKVRFAPRALSWLPFVWANYWILALADDYSYAVVGTPDREYLWILSRTPSLPEPVLERLEKLVAAQGYDAARLVRTNQSGVPE